MNKYTEDQFSVCTPEEESFFQEMDAKKVREEEAKILKQGWYWCRIKAPTFDWEPMRWDGNGFHMQGRGRTYYTGDWLSSLTVGNKIPSPGEENYGN